MSLETALEVSLEIYLDPKDPLAYLALAGTAKLLQQTGCTALWFPMQVTDWLDPGPEPAPDADRGVRHRWFRSNYRERELQHYAQVQGLPLTNLYRPIDSSIAAQALLWLAKQAEANTLIPEFLGKLTQAHWSDPNATMSNATNIAPLLRELTQDTIGFDAYCAQQGPLDLARQLESNAELGVIRGPAYRFNDQLYIGREHLPLLAELVSEQDIS